MPPSLPSSAVNIRDATARAAQLLLGLVLFGTSLALMVRANLGLTAWDVLHQGIARRTGLEIGWVVIGVGALVLLAWIPLRQRPGIGTVANVVVVGLAANAALAVLAQPTSIAWQVVFLASAVLLNGLATGLYIGAGLGPGPRDGLTTGLAQRGLSLRRVRTLIEIGVLAAGFALGGTVGIGSVVYAVSIGPMAGYLIPKLSRTTPRAAMRGAAAPPLSRSVSCTT